MYNQDTDLLFPPRLIPALRSLRGAVWQELVDKVAAQEPAALDRLAFELLMVRLGSCASCQADSYKAMHGCTQCALQIVRRFRGSDHDLVAMFQQALQDVARYLEKTRKVEQSESDYQ